LALAVAEDTSAFARFLVLWFLRAMRLAFSDEKNLSITASCQDIARAVRRAENVVTSHGREPAARRTP